MTFWEELSNIFKSKTQIEQEKQRAYDDAKNKEKFLIESLKQLDDEYQQIAPKYVEKDYDSTLPKFEKKQKEDNTVSSEMLDEIAKNYAYSGYDVKQNNIKNNYSEKLNLAGNKKSTAYKTGQDLLKDIFENSKNNKQDIANSMSGKNLYFSSIKQNLDDENLQNLKNDITKASSETNDKIKLIDDEIDFLTRKKDDAINKLDVDSYKSYKTKLDDLTTKRDAEKNKIHEYNEDLKVEQAKFNNDRQKLISDLKQKDYNLFVKQQNEIAENEKKYGYSGVKKENYDKRLQLAIDFYNTLPKELALNVAKNNPSLKNYLGEYYDELLGTINSRYERGSIFS